MGAAALLSGAHAACAAAARFAGVAAQAIAELSTTEAFAARTSCLLCRGLFSCGRAVFIHDTDAWVQRHCLAGRMLRAQLPLDSQVWRRWQFAGVAAVISCLLSLLYGTLVAGSPPEIGVLDSYPELDQNEQEVVYYVIGSMRKNLVKFRKLDVVTVGCLFGSRAEAETAGLPCRLTAEREKWGGLAYAKKELWACMHIVDRIFSKHCSAAALGRHGLEVHAHLRAALAQHEGIAALFSAAAALCTPPITAAALLSAVCETYAWSRQRVLVAQARSDLDLDHQNNKEPRAKLGIAAQLKRDQRKIAKAASTAEKAVKAAARARKKSLSRPRAATSKGAQLVEEAASKKKKKRKKSKAVK